MILGIANAVLNSSSFTFIVLVSSLCLMSAVIRFRKKLGERITVTISLAMMCLMVLVVPDLFSKYALDLAHLSSHMMFSATFLLCAIVLQYGLAEGFVSFSSGLYRLLEVGVFDRLQYGLAEGFVSFSSGLRKSHTGNLNFNMLALPFCLLLSLILLYL